MKEHLDLKGQYHDNFDSRFFLTYRVLLFRHKVQLGRVVDTEESKMFSDFLQKLRDSLKKMLTSGSF